MKTLDTFSPYKYINHLDRFIDLAEGKDIIPVMVELDLVNFCNHNCIWYIDLYYNEIICYLKLSHKPHGDFI